MFFFLFYSVQPPYPIDQTCREYDKSDRRIWHFGTTTRSCTCLVISCQPIISAFGWNQETSSISCVFYIFRHYSLYNPSFLLFLKSLHYMLYAQFTCPILKEGTHLCKQATLHCFLFFLNNFFLFSLYSVGCYSDGKKTFKKRCFPIASFQCVRTMSEPETADLRQLKRNSEEACRSNLRKQMKLYLICEICFSGLWFPRQSYLHKYLNAC